MEEDPERTELEREAQKIELLLSADASASGRHDRGMMTTLVISLTLSLTFKLNLKLNFNF